MSANKVEKHSFVILNEKLQVKIKFKTFHWLLELLYTAFALNATTTELVLLEIFAYPSNKCVTYRPELNL